MGANPRDIKNQQSLNKEIKTEVSLEQEIINLLKDRRGIQKDSLSDQQDISNVIRSQTAELKFQNEEKRLLRQLTKDINKIATDSYSISKDEIGTTKTNLSLTAQQLKLDKTLVVLEQQRVKFAAQGGELNSDIAGSIKDQQEEALKLKKSLSVIAKDSKTVGDSFGKKSFSGLADVTNSIPGLKKFASPFNEAADAARQQAASNFENFGTTKGNSKALRGNIDSYKKLRKGGMGMQDALKKAGVSAKSVKIGKIPGAKSMSPLSAGFKALGPIIKKALGPISLIIAAVDIIKFFFKAMTAGSKATADMSRKMLMTRDAAREMYTTIIPGIVGEFNEVQKATGGVTITIAAYDKALKSVNDSLGLQLNLSTDFGKQTAMNVAEVAKMQTNFGYSTKASKELFFEAMKTGKPLEQINKEIVGSVTAQASLNGIIPDMSKLLDEAAGISGNMKANFGGQVSEIANAVYQAKLMGLELGQMEGVSSNLLDFQSSIENEMKAELLLGKNLNLEKAREAALMGNTKELMRQITKEAGSQKDFLKMNIPQRKALAAAVGMEVNELADKFDKQAKMDALAKKNAEILNRLRKDGNLILGDGFDIKKASLQEIRVAAEAAGKTEEDLIKLLGDEVYARMETEDATQKFNKALDQAKEAFVRLVDGGSLDKLADILTGITESSLFAGYAEEGEAKRLKELAEAQPEGTKGKQEKIDIATAALEAQRQATGVDDVTDVAGGAAAGAAIGAGIGVWFAGVGAGPGALIGAGIGGLLALAKNVDDDTYAKQTLAQAQGLGLDGPVEEGKDFIIRPGQKPLKYNRDDVIVGGTNLGGGGGGNTEAILGRILAAIENGGDVYMDGDKVGKSLALATSRMG